MVRSVIWVALIRMPWKEVVLVAVPTFFQGSQGEKLDDSARLQSYRWDGELEIEFRHETVFRDRIWIPA